MGWFDMKTDPVITGKHCNNIKIQKKLSQNVSHKCGLCGNNLTDSFGCDKDKQQLQQSKVNILSNKLH